MSLPPLELDSGPDSQHCVLGLEEPNISLNTAEDIFWFCACLDLTVGQTKFCIFSPPRLPTQLTKGNPLKLHTLASYHTGAADNHFPSHLYHIAIHTGDNRVTVMLL